MTEACPPVLVAVAPGELLDKLSILEIKLDRIADAAKRENVAREHAVLAAARDRAGLPALATGELFDRLRSINQRLWDIEDAIRVCDRDGDFGQRFVELARSVYRTNDERAAVKRLINEACGSSLVEEKEYVDYGG